MKKTPADVVITDMRMPGMDGAELLRHIQRDFPAAARIVLSGQAERESIMRALPSLTSSCTSPATARRCARVIEQTHALHKLMQNPALTAAGGQARADPAVPTTYTELSRLAQDPKSDSAGFAKIIEMDAAVCAKVLQLVNSAYFGLGQKIVSIRPAVTYLGVEIIKSLVLGSSSFSDKAISEVKGFSPDRMQQHSMLTRGAGQEDRDQSRAGRRRPSPRACCTTSARWCCAMRRRPTTCAPCSARRNWPAIAPRPNARSSASRTPKSVPIYWACGVSRSPSSKSRGLPSPAPAEVAPESRALVAAVHIASGLVEEMTDPEAQMKAASANIDSSARIDVSFLREAGLAGKPSRRIASRRRSRRQGCRSQLIGNGGRRQAPEHHSDRRGLTPFARKRGLPP